MHIRSVLKYLIPERIKKKYRNERLRQAWDPIITECGALPVSEAFTQTYRRKLWGENEGDAFFSGGGSLERFATPYADWTIRFITEQSIRTVVDVGCGDFRVGRRICEGTGIHYIGVDVVPDLIAHNRSKFPIDGVEFKCANAIEDRLPQGDLCLIRQVLQHLTNAQIAKVLANCSEFPFLLITEDVYTGRRGQPNLDVLHGPGNRLFRQSGVYLDLPPYNLKLEHVLEVLCPETESVLRTSLIRQSPITKSRSAATD